MTNKITSFFQVIKSSKRGKPDNAGEDTSESIGISDQRSDERLLKCKLSTVGNDTPGTIGNTITTSTPMPLHDDDNVDNSTSTTKRMKLSNECDEVQQLLMHLNDNTTVARPNKGWKAALQNHFESKSFQTLSKFIATERRMHKIYPPTQNVWSALNLCALHSVKVVIVGQDPYHGPNQAHGLSFSVLPGCPIPPSLKNIYKELMDDPKVSNFNSLPRHGHLIRWVQQGVLLLNAVMTVRDNQPNSHQNKGWEKVTDEIIRAVLRYHCTNTENRSTSDVALSSNELRSGPSTSISIPHAQGKGCVFLLWGKPATTKAMTVIESVMMNTNKSNRNATTAATKKSKTHAIICTSHPSPLGARKTSTPFLGSQCFSRCNEELIAMGHDPIDWNV